MSWKTATVPESRRDHRDHEAIVELTRVAGPVEVAALLAALEANGIKAMTSTDDGGMRPSVTYVEGSRVLVFEGDLERARRVLRAFRS